MMKKSEKYKFSCPITSRSIAVSPVIGSSRSWNSFPDWLKKPKPRKKPKCIIFYKKRNYGIFASLHTWGVQSILGLYSNLQSFDFHLTVGSEQRRPWNLHRYAVNRAIADLHWCTKALQYFIEILVRS